MQAHSAGSAVSYRALRRHLRGAALGACGFVGLQALFQHCAVTLSLREAVRGRRGRDRLRRRLVRARKVGSAGLEGLVSEQARGRGAARE